MLALVAAEDLEAAEGWKAVDCSQQLSQLSNTSIQCRTLLTSGQVHVALHNGGRGLQAMIEPAEEHKQSVELQPRHVHRAMQTVSKQSRQHRDIRKVNAEHDHGGGGLDGGLQAARQL